MKTPITPEEARRIAAKLGMSPEPVPQKPKNARLQIDVRRSDDRAYMRAYRAVKGEAYLKYHREKMREYRARNAGECRTGGEF